MLVLEQQPQTKTRVVLVQQLRSKNCALQRMRPLEARLTHMCSVHSEHSQAATAVRSNCELAWAHRQYCHSLQPGLLSMQQYQPAGA